MPSSQIIGVLFGLTSALVWGSADFCGGLAARRISQFQALALSSSAGLAILLVAAWIRGESGLTTADLFWASGAGILGALGIAALYQGLASGNITVVAPTAAVIGAALPVLFGSLLEGFPGFTRLAGFFAGALGIWFVAKTPSEASSRINSGLRLGILAGISFGAFFILIAQVHPGSIFAPLAVSKTASVGLALILLWARREKLPWPPTQPIALLAGILDAGGNIFYLLATQFTRLDIAVVLSSMYPASTVILAGFILGERSSPAQWAGVMLCLVAVALIAI